MASHDRVLLADSHPNMLEAVRGLLVGKFATIVMVGDEASLLDAAARLGPDLVIVDLSLPVSGSVNILRTLLGRLPGLRVLVLSVHDEPTAARQAFTLGAAGFVLTRRVAVDLRDAVDAVLRGETYGAVVC
ncbi:MAG TPA: response regulator transcription factor [Gemmataceae bacterium]|jgi:DNA-binding NarL/FixJ family response regulator